MSRRAKRVWICIGIVAILILFSECSRYRLPQYEVWQKSQGTEHKQELILWYTRKELKPYLDAVTQECEKECNITLTCVAVSELEYLEQIKQAGMDENSRTPDLFLMSNSDLEKSYLLGLTDIPISQAYLEKNYVEPAIDAVTYQGNAYAYPLFYETGVMVYNKQYMDKTPAYISEIINFAENSQQIEGVEHIFTWDAMELFYDYLFAGAYAVMGGENGDDIAQISLDGEKLKQSLTYYQSLNPYFAIDAKQMSEERIVDEFAQGKIIFAMIGNQDLKKLEDKKTAGESQVDYGVGSLPDLTEELQGRGLSVTGSVAVNTLSEHVELADKAARYLTGKGAEQLYRTTGLFGTAKGLSYENPEFSNSLEQYTGSCPVSKLMEASECWLKWESMFLNIWNGNDVSAEVDNLSSYLQNKFHTE